MDKIKEIFNGSTDIIPNYFFKDGKYFPTITARLRFLDNGMPRALFIVFDQNNLSFTNQQEALLAAENDYKEAFQQYKDEPNEERTSKIIKFIVQKGYVLHDNNNFPTVDNKIPMQ